MAIKGGEYVKKVSVYMILILIFILSISIFISKTISITKSNLIAQIQYGKSSYIEESTSYKYYIYKIKDGIYYYEKERTTFWIREDVSKKIIKKGIIKDKDSLQIIYEDVKNNSEPIHIFDYKGYKINYSDKELNSLEELTEKLF